MKELLDNGMVRETTTRDLPRYSGACYYSDAECDLIVQDFKELNKIWTMKHSREGFETLDTGENWEPDGESVGQDIESFQRYLDETYGQGKYKAYGLGAYIHSATSFAFNTGEDRRCQWDSGTVGFVGINTELNIDLDNYASQLSDAWNGWVCVLEVYDNLTDESVDEILSTEPAKVISEWKERMKEKYGVTEFKEQQ